MDLPIEALADPFTHNGTNKQQQRPAQDGEKAAAPAPPSAHDARAPPPHLPSDSSYVLHPYLLIDKGFGQVLTVWCLEEMEEDTANGGEEGASVRSIYTNPAPILYARAMGTTTGGLCLWLVLIQGAERPWILFPKGSPESDYMARWKLEARRLYGEQQKSRADNDAAAAAAASWGSVRDRELETRRMYLSLGYSEPSDTNHYENPGPAVDSSNSIVEMYDFDLEESMHDEIYADAEDDAFGEQEKPADEWQVAESLRNFALQAMGDEGDWLFDLFEADWTRQSNEYATTYGAPSEASSDESDILATEEEEAAVAFAAEDEDDYGLCTPYSDPSVLLASDDPAILDSTAGWARVASQRAAQNLARGVHSWLAQIGIAHPPSPVLPTTQQDAAVAKSPDGDDGAKEASESKAPPVAKAVKFDVNHADADPSRAAENGNGNDADSHPEEEAPSRLCDPGQRLPSRAERELSDGTWYCMTVPEYLHWKLHQGLPIAEASVLRTLENISASKASVPPWLSGAVPDAAHASNLSAAMRSRSREILALADTYDELIRVLDHVIQTHEQEKTADAKQGGVVVSGSLWQRVCASFKDAQKARLACFGKHTPLDQRKK